MGVVLEEKVREGARARRLMRKREDLLVKHHVPREVYSVI